MKYYQFWQEIKKKLVSNLDIILMIVGNHEGSSPGKQGFKMFLDSKGGRMGTIGGGIMEAKILEKAKSIIENNKSHRHNLLIEQVHNKKADSENQSGLICAGKQWIILYRLNEGDLPTLESIIEAQDTLSALILKITATSFDLNKEESDEFDFDFQKDEDWYYKEKIGDPYIVHVFGGGHVGNSITRILQTLNFYIIQYENRPDFTMFEANKYAHRKISGSFLETADNIKSGPKVFVVVTTYSFDTDYHVLMNVLEKRINYIGLMGSKTKIAKIFQMLRDDGFSRELIDLVKAPIGLDISDGSIQEIAISVVAELLKVKNNPSLGIY
ncbi:MAG: hypothetical protein HeimC2_38600 [Candidatus Heimdallarchaeota archaeon LC_2]|nr:MAG: hypothetical protein HeimC2_38600 [Candidatus Heimdallarchaeota archaeon LC_2]